MTERADSLPIYQLLPTYAPDLNPAAGTWFNLHGELLTLPCTAPISSSL
ncbi:hypothetical protein [Streptosporangium subroseum]|nr:transposase [Streptosporangium subroseum]